MSVYLQKCICWGIFQECLCGRLQINAQKRLRPHRKSLVFRWYLAKNTEGLIKFKILCDLAGISRVQTWRLKMAVDQTDIKTRERGDFHIGCIKEISETDA